MDDNECDCPDVQLLQNRIIRIQQQEFLGPSQFARVSAQCDGDSVLIGGGCALMDWEQEKGKEFNLSRSGFSPDQPDSWDCAWNNPSSGRNRMLATAVCLNPPDHGPDLTQGRIFWVEEQMQLNSQGATTFRAACEPGHLLIGGSCMIDADDSSSHYVTMYHHGIERFDDGKSDPFHIWRCAWNNPTTRTPMAIV
ncbi:MAG: hypothetical protein MJE77_17170, partial [Proteobacteria bacterium]|nr:hypothetical protein [Pseudomonadota bacterium]